MSENRKPPFSNEEAKKQARLAALQDNMGFPQAREKAQETFIAPNKPQAVRKRRQSFDELYQRKTIYVARDLLEIIDDIVNEKRGEQTKIINNALRMYLSDPENIKAHTTLGDWEKQFIIEDGE